MKARTAGDAYVGDRIREARHAVRMSQGELGKRLGVTFQQIQKFETGANRVGVGQLVVLAKALKKPLTFFFPGSGATGRGRSDPHLSRFLASKEGFELAQRFSRISPQRQALVLDLVGQLEDKNGRHGNREAR